MIAREKRTIRRLTSSPLPSSLADNNWAGPSCAECRGSQKGYIKSVSAGRTSHTHPRCPHPVIPNANASPSSLQHPGMRVDYMYVIQSKRSRERRTRACNWIRPLPRPTSRVCCTSIGDSRALAVPRRALYLRRINLGLPRRVTSPSARLEPRYVNPRTW